MKYLWPYFSSRIEEISELFIIGKPDMTVVAFGSDVIDIFEVNDILSSKGWHLNALQRPNRLVLSGYFINLLRLLQFPCSNPLFNLFSFSLPSLHICITLQHVTVYENFLNDLRESVKTVCLFSKHMCTALLFYLSFCFQTFVSLFSVKSFISPHQSKLMFI